MLVGVPAHDKGTICWISSMSIINLHNFHRHIDVIFYASTKLFFPIVAKNVRPSLTLIQYDQ